MRPLALATVACAKFTVGIGVGIGVGVAVVMAGCATSQPIARPAQPTSNASNQSLAAPALATVDAWHEAAATGDSARYFSLMTDDAVFLGTDATERWTRREFEAFAEPYFDRPNQPAWVYVPRKRHMSFAAGGRVAWFDELLDSPTYGTARGSGVLEKGTDGRWRIAHYDLTFPIPNDLAPDVTQRIRAYEETRDPAASER